MESVDDVVESPGEPGAGDNWTPPELDALPATPEELVVAYAPTKAQATRSAHARHPPGERSKPPKLGKAGS